MLVASCGCAVWLQFGLCGCEKPLGQNGLDWIVVEAQVGRVIQISGYIYIWSFDVEIGDGCRYIWSSLKVVFWQSYWRMMAGCLNLDLSIVVRWHKGHIGCTMHQGRHSQNCTPAKYHQCWRSKLFLGGAGRREWQNESQLFPIKKGSPY